MDMVWFRKKNGSELQFMDSMEALLSRNDGVLEPADYNYSISFIAAGLDFGQIAEESIESVARIGEDLGRDFEIVITLPLKINLKSMARILYLREIHPEFISLSMDFLSDGEGKTNSFRNSKGKFIIPFDLERIYPVEYSDVLHSFLKLKLKRLFYSELTLMHRDLIDEVGGWRPLDVGSDLDLYSRISINYGTLAFPSNIMGNEGITIDRVLRLSRIFDLKRALLSESVRVIRNFIVSCNLSFHEIREILNLIEDYEGINLKLAGFLAYLGKRSLKVKPVIFDRNNLVVFMESVLESLVLKEYQRLGDIGDRVHFSLNRVFLNFLKNNSKLFRELNSSLNVLLSVK